MENLDLSKIKNVHFVGIGGIGISAIARLMLNQGKDVTGQDMQEGLVVDELSKLGAKIMIGQSYENIPSDTELIVYTTAIITYDPKFFAKIKEQQKISIRSYPQMLGIITKDKYTIAVSGTHGKTTTTAMIAKILVDTGKDPSVIVGSLLNPSTGSGQDPSISSGQGKTNLIIGKSDFFVVEACEYERSFLNLKPKILVITNIEEDHLDYYKDISDIESAFSEIAGQTDNFIVCDPSSVSVFNILKKKYKTKVIDYRDYLDKVPKVAVPGVHNRIDASVALAVADILEIKDEEVQKSIAQFSGTWRRLEKRGQTKDGIIIYDDYAHHPTEIKASIEALRELYPAGEKKITVLFQPHLYSRTKALFNDFAKCFKGADNIYLLPIFFAREEKDESISSDKLASAICLAGDKAKAFLDFNGAESFIKELNFGKDDVFVTMGAGEAYKVVDKIFDIS
jgi:UDP-N-acetylmuramate--alanine ligase